MGERFSQVLVPGAILGCCLLGVYVAIFRPGYANNEFYLGVLIFLQILVAAVWKFRERFLWLLLLSFLFAGTLVPFHDAWTSGRWMVLLVGALIGYVIYMKDRNHHFATLHLVALFCVLAAVVSAIVSVYPTQAALKAASLLLLFLYGSAGARLAVAGRENKFFSQLLLGCEICVYFTALDFFVFHLEFFDNPNSMGATMGIVIVPILLWGVLTTEGTVLKRRRSFALLVATVLLLSSYARAGFAGAAIATLLLCWGLKRYRFLLKSIGIALVAAMLVVAVVPLRPDEAEGASVTTVFLYKGQRDVGVLGSRKSAWQRTSEVIQQHPWFGSGFGTSITKGEVPDQIESFSSAPNATREHGNSYLAITEWVGLLGVLPFFTLVTLLAVSVYRVVAWMRRVGSGNSPCVPLMAVLAAGLVHAVFEDWLFAVGYYVTVFFWVCAFVLVDYLPPLQSRTSPIRPSQWWRPLETSANVPSFNR